MSDDFLLAVAATPCTRTKLVDELVALAIPGVRTYSVVGPPDVCEGVYAWDDAAPPDTFEHLAVDASAAKVVRATVAGHIPDKPLVPVLERIDATLRSMSVAPGSDADKIRQALLSELEMS